MSWPPDPLAFVAAGCALLTIAALVATPAPFLRTPLQFDRGDLVALCVALGTLAATGIVAGSIALHRQDVDQRERLDQRTVDRAEVRRIARRQAHAASPSRAELRRAILKQLRALRTAGPRERRQLLSALQALGIRDATVVQQPDRRQDRSSPTTNADPAPPRRGRRPPGRPGAGGPVGDSGSGSPPPERPPPASDPPATVTTPPDVTLPLFPPLTLPRPPVCVPPLVSVNGGCGRRR